MKLDLTQTCANCALATMCYTRRDLSRTFLMRMLVVDPKYRATRDEMHTWTHAQDKESANVVLAAVAHSCFTYVRKEVESEQETISSD